MSYTSKTYLKSAAQSALTVVARIIHAKNISAGQK
jgi:hypothetical protein